MLVLQAGEGVLPGVAGPTAARDEASAMAQQLLVLTRVAEVHSELGGEPVEEIHVCGGEVLLLFSPPLWLCRKQRLTHADTDTQADAAHCTDGDCGRIKPLLSTPSLVRLRETGQRRVCVGGRLAGCGRTDVFSPLRHWH